MTPLKGLNPIIYTANIVLELRKSQCYGHLHFPKVL